VRNAQKDKERQFPIRSNRSHISANKATYLWEERDLTGAKHSPVEITEREREVYPYSTFTNRKMKGTRFIADQRTSSGEDDGT